MVWSKIRVMPIEELIATMYIVDNVGWVDFNSNKLIIPITKKSFPDGKHPTDHLIEDLKEMLTAMCEKHFELEDKLFLPVNFRIEEHWDGTNYEYKAFYKTKFLHKQSNY